MIFEVHNSRTVIHAASPQELRHFDLETKYPTAVAEAISRGFALPELEDSGWDGWIRLLHVPKTQPPWILTGLTPRLIQICEKMQFPYELMDKRHRPDPGFPEFSGPTKIIDRDYQLKGADCAVEMGRGVLDMVPRSGKTRTMVEIMRRIALPAIWIAPTDRIVRQTVETIERFLGKNFAIHQIGSKDETKACLSPVVVCTAATAGRLSEEFYKSREVIIIDEYHHAAAKTYHNDIFSKCDHIYYRYGMTGTFFRSGTDDLALHALLSTTIYKVTAEELLAKGFLVPTQVVFLPVDVPKLRGLPAQTFQGGHGTYGIQEHKYRNQLVTFAAVKLYQTGRKVLVLVGTKKQGRELKHMIQAFVRPAPDGCQFQTTEFLSTDTDRRIQTLILDSFLEDQEVKILIGTSLLGEGVDLPSADALVYARGEKAEVTLTQNAYRVGTASPGKSEAIIIDFADRHHRKLMEHSMERLNVYHKEKTFGVKVLADANRFGEWLIDRKCPNPVADTIS